ELIGAERVPEPPILRSPAIALRDLLLQPIDVVVHGELHQRDTEHKQERARHQHEIDERRERGMDSGMKETAGMAVSALVQILVRSLQIGIGDGLLEHQDRDSGEGKNREVRHLLYFDKASVVPSQLGGGGLTRK